jgi:hypothetical protein
LLQDEVQGHGVSFTVIASAGIYKPVFENDDYIFYRGGPVIIKHALGTEDLAGGLALSKRRIGQAFIYETDKKGEPSVLNRRVRAPMLIKP